jgi:hypothetical protein
MGSVPEGQRPGAGRIAVTPELVREQLVDPIRSRVMEILERSPSRTLDEGWEEARRSLAPEAAGDEDTERLARALAQAGYATREVELEMFEPASAAVPWLDEQIGTRAHPAEDTPAARRRTCIELTLTEPDEQPAPDSGAASWRIPGPGAHVRHLVALDVAAELAEKLVPGRTQAPRGLSRPRDVKRCFLYGFFTCCCEQVQPESPA